MPHYDNDRKDVIARAEDAGVVLMITVGTDMDDSEMAVKLAEENKSIFATVGIHPHEVGDIENPEETYSNLRSLASRQKVVALGETGLDYHYLHSSAHVQKEHFRIMIRIAEEVNLPLIIHSRDAREDTISMLMEEKYSGRGVFHCFSGDIEMARKALDMGFYISFSGVVTFKNARKIIEVLKYVPHDRLLIETDAPYLTPEPYRGKRNEPAFVKYVGQKVAQIHGLAERSLQEIILNNTRELFGIEHT